ncbi:MAG TPA: type II 3-dehydroquinate dehydratase [Terricaulis sp.]|nr:type II 3-dehydroquinate dehydratase [Terricaulis sp.]
MSQQKKVRVLNGPNLNLLGAREPEIYGSATLAQIAEGCIRLGAERGLDVEFLQSNHEGQLIDWIQGAIDHCDAIVINAAAFTHTSVAIHDALRAYKGYKIELHISNPHLREEFRHTSYVAPAVDAVVAGLGVGGYALVVGLLGEVL